MILDVGNVEQFENPSAEQVKHYLHFMPPESPFVVLSASDDRSAAGVRFIQAVPCDRGYHVEYREEGRMYFVEAPLEQAARLFESFRVGDESFKTAVAWRRLRLIGDRVRSVLLVGLLALLLCALGLAVWSAIR
jgi:hypothetical protein